MNISDEAIEVAAKAAHLSKLAGVRWEDIPGWKKTDRLSEARAALEVAAPHMLAGAWDEGANAGWKQSGEGWNAEYPDQSTGECSVDLSSNPYGSFR